MLLLMRVSLRGESQQEPQPAEQTQEGVQFEETEPAPQPQLRRSGCTRALVTPRADLSGGVLVHHLDHRVRLQ